MSVGGEGGREAPGYIRRKLAMFILYVEMYSVTVARGGWGVAQIFFYVFTRFEGFCIKWKQKNG